MIRILRRSRGESGPVLIHAVTQKGRGYQPAEAHPDQYHGVAPFLIESGESRDDERTPCGKVAAKDLAAYADNDIRICAITAAMPTGTGLDEFQKAHPERFFDVGIAEEHAVTMAAGMASQGMKPYVAIYSTFLQRAFDQIAMDVCRNQLPVTFLIDRAGVVGEDGETHQGFMDLSYLRQIPNMIVAAPRDARDLKMLIALSLRVDAPMAIRYPKTCEDLGAGIQSQSNIEVGQWEVISTGEDVIIFAVGRMVQSAMLASIDLLGKRVSAGVIDARFVKPMDEKTLLKHARSAKLVVTVEENVLSGGFGEGVMELMSSKGLEKPILSLGLPDRFIGHATVAEQLEDCALTPQGISQAVLSRLETLAEARI